MASRRPVTLSVHSVFIYADTGPGWAPADPGHFHVDGTVFVGPAADGPSDAFDFELCTPSWLAEHFDDRAASSPPPPQVPGPEPTPPVQRGVGRWWFGEHRVLFGRGLILVRRWDRELIERAIGEAFADLAGPTWPLAADRAGRLLPWEYDYRHDEQIDQQHPDVPHPG